MIRVNADDINDESYWNEVFEKEFATDKQRLDNERLDFIDRNIKKWYVGHNNTYPRFADFGCGEGELLRWLYYKHPRLAVFGVDISNWAIQEVTEYAPPHHKYMVADLNKNVPFSADSMDIVFCGETLEHLLDPNVVITQLITKVAKGGYFIFSVPNKHYNPTPEHNFIFNCWDIFKIAFDNNMVVEDFDVVAGGISIIACLKKE